MMADKKLTIEEIEKVMSGEGRIEIEILPSGEIKERMNEKAKAVTLKADIGNLNLIAELAELYENYYKRGNIMLAQGLVIKDQIAEVEALQADIKNLEDQLDRFAGENKDLIAELVTLRKVVKEAMKEAESRLNDVLAWRTDDYAKPLSYYDGVVEEATRTSYNLCKLVAKLEGYKCKK